MARERRSRYEYISNKPSDLAGWVRGGGNASVGSVSRRQEEGSGSVVGPRLHLLGRYRGEASAREACWKGRGAMGAECRVLKLGKTMSGGRGGVVAAVSRATLERGSRQSMCDIGFAGVWPLPRPRCTGTLACSSPRAPSAAPQMADCSRSTSLACRTRSSVSSRSDVSRSSVSRVTRAASSMLCRRRRRHRAVANGAYGGAPLFRCALPSDDAK